jgi:hypothetical protein
MLFKSLLLKSHDFQVQSQPYLPTLSLTTI